MVRQYTGYIADFVRYGTPTSGGNAGHLNPVEWKPWTKEKSQYLYIDNAGKLQGNYHVKLSLVIPQGWKLKKTSVP